MALPFYNSVAQCTPAYGSPSNYGSGSFTLASGSGAAVAAALGSAAAYSLLAGSGVTNVGSTTITGGNVGSSPTASVTGLTSANFTAPAVIDNTNAGAAKTALTAAISYYQGLTPTLSGLSNLSTGGNGSTAATYTAGNYFGSTSLTMPTGIILDAQGNSAAQFVFVAGSTINLASGQAITLVNGALAANVVFVAGTSFTSVATSTVNGNVLAAASVTLGGGVLNGRALAGTGAVTISAATAITTTGSGASAWGITAATKASPTAVTVTVGAPGTTKYEFALIANYADGTVSPPTYVAVANGAAGATTYAFAFTAAAGAASYSIYSVSAAGATTGTLVVANTTANPYTSGSITPTAGTTVLPSSLAFNQDGGPAPSRGMIHLRTSAVGGSTTTAASFTVTDGTTTEQVGSLGPVAAGVAVDETVEFNTDLNITAVNTVINFGGGTYTAAVDWEVSLV